MRRIDDAGAAFRRRLRLAAAADPAAVADSATAPDAVAVSDAAAGAASGGLRVRLAAAALQQSMRRSDDADLALRTPTWTSVAPATPLGLLDRGDKMLADKPDALAPRPLAGAGSGRCARPCGGAGASPSPRRARQARRRGGRGARLRGTDRPVPGCQAVGHRPCRCRGGSRLQLAPCGLMRSAGSSGAARVGMRVDGSGKARLAARRHGSGGAAWMSFAIA